MSGSDGTIHGIYGEVTKADVSSLNTDKALGLMMFAVMLTQEEKRFHCIELLFKDFAGDPRPISQIPEIAAWCKCVHERLNHFLGFLSPRSMLRYLEVIAPDSFNRNGDQVTVQPSKASMTLLMMVTATIRHNFSDFLDAAAIDQVVKDLERNYVLMFQGGPYLINQKGLFSGASPPDAARFESWRKLGVVLG